MRLKPKYELYSSGGNEQTRLGCDQVLKEYDSFMSKLLSDCNVWRFIALISMVCFIGSLILLMYIENKPKTELVVVSVNDIGETKYVGTTRGINFEDFNQWEPSVKNMIMDFIDYTYTVSTDEDLMFERFKKCLYLLDENKRQNYEVMIKKNDPFQMVGQKKRNVEIESIIPISVNSYQADFKVIESQITGYAKNETKKRGIFSVRQVSKEGYANLTEKERVNNPPGIFITEFNIVDIEGDK